MTDVNLPVILFAAFIAAGSPGPATLAIAGTSMSSGRRAGAQIRAIRMVRQQVDDEAAAFDHPALRLCERSGIAPYKPQGDFVFWRALCDRHSNWHATRRFDHGDPGRRHPKPDHVSPLRCDLFLGNYGIGIRPCKTLV